MFRVRLEVDPPALPLYSAALAERGHQLTSDAPDFVVVGLEPAIRAGWLDAPADAHLPGAPSASDAPDTHPGPLVIGLDHASFASLVAARTQVAAVFSWSEGPAALVAAIEGTIALATTTLDVPLPSPQDVDRLDPAGPDAELQRVVARIANGLNVEVALVTLIDAERQTFAAAFGAPADLAEARGTPVSWSFCEHVVRAGTALVVGDALRHPVFMSTPLVVDRIVGAYAGVPLRVDGRVVGAVCAISSRPHRFSAGDLGLLELAADAAGGRLAEIARLPRLVIRPRSGDDAGLVIDGRWRLTTHIGYGGQGSVWAARELGSGRLVAVKLERGNATVLTEARALAAVRHPSLVSVHAAGHLPDGRGFLVMDHVAGSPIDDALDSDDTVGRSRDAFVLARISELAGALNSLHAAGFLHGDIKALNVLLDDTTQRAVLVDLGLGLSLGDVPLRPLGTCGSSAPEQFAVPAVPLDTRIDTYGLAAVTFELLSGRGPFQSAGRERHTTLAAQRAGRATRLSSLRPDLAHLDATFAAALSPHPEQRPRSPAAWAAGLIVGHGGALPGHPTRAEALLVLQRIALAADRAKDLYEDLDEPTRDALAAAEHGAAYVPTEALVAWLDAWSGGSLAAVHTLATLVGGMQARALVRSTHAVFEPRALALAVPAILRRMHPWIALDLNTCGPDAVRGELQLPFAGAILCAWFRGVIEPAFAQAGAKALPRFTLLAQSAGTEGSPASERWQLELGWR